jgi:hypothetical protein
MARTHTVLLAELRFELSDAHTYEFVQGVVPCQAAEGGSSSIWQRRRRGCAGTATQLFTPLANMCGSRADYVYAGLSNAASNVDQYFSYYDDNPQSMVTALATR